MFNHIMVGSNDIERSKRFYDAVLGTLGAGEPLRDKAATGHIRLFYRHNGNTFCVSEPINGEPATFANGGTIGFKCDSPEQVRAFHDVAVRLKRRRACATEASARCISPMCAIPTATSSARFIE